MVVRRGQWAGGDTSLPPLAPLRPGPWLPAQPPGNQSSREGKGHQPRPPGTEDSEARAALVSLTAAPQWGTVPLPTLLLSEPRCGEVAPGDLAFLPLAHPPPPSRPSRPLMDRNTLGPPQSGLCAPSSGDPSARPDSGASGPNPHPTGLGTQAPAVPAPPEAALTPPTLPT